MTTSAREVAMKCAKQAIADLGQICGLLDQGQYEEASDYCRAAAECYTQDLAATLPDTNAVPLPRHLVRRGMLPDGTFPPSDDDEPPDAQELVKLREHFTNGGRLSEWQISSILNLAIEARSQAEEIVALRRDYLELIYAVGNKWPGETRHQTALRYIYNAEHQDHGPSQAAAIDSALAQGKEKPA